MIYSNLRGIDTFGSVIMKRILFQGDSITDCARNREDIVNLGGYPKNVGATLGCNFPSEYNFVNNGISRNRIVDVYARIKSDIIKIIILEPFALKGIATDNTEQVPGLKNLKR